MLRDVFYYGAKPNVHPRERFAENLDHARKLCTTEHFWIVNEYCDYTNFDWNFDFDFLPDEDVWAQDHINVWPSQHQKDSGTWLCSKEESEIKIYRSDVSPVKRKNEKHNCWKIYTPIDEKQFDFSWHPDPTDPLFIFVWGNKYVDGVFEPTIEYHTPGAVEKKYMFQHAPILPQWERWNILKDIDKTKFDFTWRPDPREPPYIYTWGNKYEPAEITPTLEYRMPGATEVKYVSEHVEMLPQWDRWEIPNNLDKESFDFTWRPDPREPSLIYQFGTQWQKTDGPKYVMPDATEIKYISVQYAKILSNPNKENWVISDNIDVSEFDFSWHPDSTEEPYIYQFGTQWQKTGGPKYIVENATQVKYINVTTAKALPNKDKWSIPNNIDVTTFDFSWHPDDTEPPYIYDAGTQWQKNGGPKYIVEGATQIKYIENNKSQALPDKTNWHLPAYIDEKSWDFSWHPDTTEPPYIYYFPTQWALSGGPVYTVPGATEKKYLEGPIAKALINMDNWEIHDYIDKDSFDFSWHPYIEDTPFVYHFATQHQKTGGPIYRTPGSDHLSPIKYIDRRIIKAKRLPNKTNWEIPDNIDIDSIDFSWHPDETEDPYIYQFGTQWHDRGGPRYIVPGATIIKYSQDIKSKLKSDRTNWEILSPIVEDEFDFSWHPHPDDPPYIYVFGNSQYPAEEMPTLRYVVEGATEYKYMKEPIAKLAVDMKNWIIPEDVDVTNFDFSWHPHPMSPPFIYEFGTQWQKTGGPRYVVKDAKEVNYVAGSKAIYKPKQRSKYWQVSENLDISEFDFSWHPDSTDKPYIYVFGTQWALSGGPKYIVPKAKEIKYMDKPIAKMRVNMKNWEVPGDIEASSFDFSWHPYEEDLPYIYQFGTQWQKTGGPRYITPGADEMSPIKYIDRRILQAKKLPDKSNFETVTKQTIKDFDYSWHPDTTEEPYIYVFGNEQYSAELMPTIQYVVKDAKKIKYVNNPKAKLGADMSNWKVEKHLDMRDFDFTWLPDPTSPPYIYEFATVWNNRGGPLYIVPGATEKKYIEDIKAKTLPNKKHWKTILPINEDEFDYSWMPHPEAPPYIYVFGNQWNRAEIEPTIEYIVPGATDKKYVHDIVGKVLPNKLKFKSLLKIEENGFDYSWRPDPNDPPYIYVFGNQHYSAEKMPTIEYQVGSATDKKYINDIHAKLAPNYSNWREIIPVDKTKFDFSWRPDPDDPAYIYVFGNQWNRAQVEPTLEYVVPGAVEKKYIETIVAHVLPNREKFEICIDIDDFDFSWRPNPNDPPYIYVFGNQWNTAEKEPTVKYYNKQGTEFKYISNLQATVSQDLTKWKIPEGFYVESFDFSWRPDPYEPAFIYEFATEYSDRGGPKYVIEGATETKYMSFIKAKLKANIVPKYYIETTLDELVSWHPTEVFWALQKSIRYDNFDFNWRPTKDVEKYVNVFGSPESELTQTYFIHASHYIAGNKDKNFIQQETKAESEYLAELFVQPDIFFVDRGNPETQERFEQLKARFTNVSKTRFLNSWVDTINRCINRSNTEVCWILNSELDYTNFDFKYYPNPWQMKMVHVFGTKWSHWGTTFMVNRETFSEDTKYIKIIEHLSNLNFVKDRRAKVTNNLYDVYVINHGNKELEQVVESIKQVTNNKTVNVIDYDKNYLQTIKNIVNKIVPKKEHYIWICSSICNYNSFDFTYICDPFARENLHVFPSDNQKFGDTFLIDVNYTKTIITELEVLQQYNKVNYNSTIKTKRLPAPIIKVGTDTHVGSINTSFDFPYAIFTTEEFKTNDVETVNLWQDDTKELIITSTGATRVIVPKEAQSYIKNELYDYPYIKTASKLLSSKPLDIVFLSNGEKNAEENYKHLLAVTEGLKNRVVRVDGINGRVEAYHAAVKASETPWAFTVFAKLKVNPKFDWGWQPDRLQMPKHYIFHAKNPVNGLEYGHQGMIAYNKSLTLNNFGEGLDFTLDDLHETVELVSGIANFNTDSYSTWRTAFREVIKLKSDYTEISQERLSIWLTKAKGKFAKECLQGANDALEYYEQVSGDMDQLKLSYEWSWLKDYYNRKYK